MADAETLRARIDDAELWEQLLEDQEMLAELIAPLDMERVLNGEQSPLFFGSAMTNFGVQLFLDKFCDLGTMPGGRLAKRTAEVKGKKAKDGAQPRDDDDEADELIPPGFSEFSGFVFKTQANLDPKHRDRLAYIRIVSGAYQKGMKVSHSRSKPGKKYSLAQAQTLFGSDRASVEEAYPGDVIGINNPGNWQIGDTLFTGERRRRSVRSGIARRPVTRSHTVSAPRQRHDCLPRHSLLLPGKICVHTQPESIQLQSVPQGHRPIAGRGSDTSSQAAERRWRWTAHPGGGRSAAV